MPAPAVAVGRPLIPARFYPVPLPPPLRPARRATAAAYALGNLIAATVTLPFAIPSFGALTVSGAAVLLYLGIVQLGLAYWLFGRGVRLVPAAEASLISMLEPVLNPVWVAIFWGEKPSPWA